MTVQDYQIKEKDILKIGRVKFVVKKIGYSEHSLELHKNFSDENDKERGDASNSIFDKPNDELFEEFHNVEEYILNQEEVEDDQHSRCRICYMSEATPSNPLLNACKCKG